MSDIDIVRCPHCGTDFTPSHMRAEIERLTAEVVEDHALLVASAAQITRLREECARMASEKACLKIEVERQNRILREINTTCYVPSGSRHAYTHFQADFDKIRELTTTWAALKDTTP